MVASDIKEIRRDWLFTVLKLASANLSKLRKRVLHTAYKVVIHCFVAAKFYIGSKKHCGDPETNQKSI